jgi:hypothetical protein
MSLLLSVIIYEEEKLAEFVLIKRYFSNKEEFYLGGTLSYILQIPYFSKILNVFLDIIIRDF